MDRDAAWYLLLAGVLGWLIWHAPHDSFETVESYRLVCKSSALDDPCPAGYGPGPHRTFAVSRERQLVIVVLHDEPNVVLKLEHCSVYDSDNWNCTVGPSGGEVISCAEGECRSSGQAVGERPVGRIRYYLTTVLDWF